MPSSRVHRVDAKLKGYDPKVNELMDLPFAWLKGKHRILFHSPDGPASAPAVGYIIDGPRGVAGALSHLALDSIRSKEIRQNLEIAAMVLNPRKTKAIVVTGSPPKVEFRAVYVPIPCDPASSS